MGKTNQAKVGALFTIIFLKIFGSYNIKANRPIIFSSLLEIVFRNENNNKASEKIMQDFTIKKTSYGSHHILLNNIPTMHIESRTESIGTYQFTFFQRVKEFLRLPHPKEWCIT